MHLKTETGDDDESAAAGIHIVLTLSLCKDQCYKYQNQTKRKYYSDGNGRCKACEMYIKWTGKYCPCCGGRLRKKPKSLKLKEHNYERI